MAVKYICDGCGEEVTMRVSRKPGRWYQREDGEGEQHACSRDCIDKIADKTGKSRVVLPW